MVVGCHSPNIFLIASEKEAAVTDVQAFWAWSETDEKLKTDPKRLFVSVRDPNMIFLYHHRCI